MSDLTAVDRSPDDPVSGAPADGELAQIQCDQRQRWLRGQRTLVEVYIQSVPALATQADAIFALVVSEIHLRQELGEAPGRPEYVQRFPELADRLAVHFETAGINRADTELTEDPQPRRGPGGTVIDDSDSGATTQFEESLPENSDDDPTLNREASEVGAPTSIIEASEALAREFAQRKAAGSGRTPDTSTIVQLLQGVLKHPAGGRERARPIRPLRAVPGYEI